VLGLLASAGLDVERGGDAGVAEVISFEHQIVSGGLGQCVCEAVTDVQAGLVAAALAEIAVCVAGNAGLVTGNGSTCSSAVSTSSSKRRLATGSRLAPITTAVSSQFAPEIRLIRARSMARAISPASGSARNVAIRAEVSMITQAARARHRAGRRADASWPPEQRT
jgi:hypothetical protein